MSLSNNLTLKKTCLINILNEYYGDIISQLNISLINYEQLSDIITDKPKYKTIIDNFSLMKKTIQNYYIKMNDEIKSLVSF